MKKGKHFRRRKKERKGEERKHFGRRNGRERRGNISEGETERKGEETFWKEKWKGKERKHFTEKEEGKKIRKEEKACRGSHSDVVGYGELSFHYSRGLAYQGIVGGIACRVRVNG